MNWKNRLLTLACRVIPIKKHPQTKERRILIVTTTALGDTLWSTPTIESLRKSFPNSYLAVLTSPVGFEVLKTNPWIDSIHQFKEPLLRKFLSLWKLLYAKKFDTILILHSSQRLILPLCSLLGASQIIGTSGINKGLDALLTDPLPANYEHEIVRRLRMVEKIGGEIHTETLSFYTDPKASIATLPKGRWIAIHPGSKDGFKRWPAKNFAQLGKSLQEKLGCRILITGTKEEQKLMEEVASAIPTAQLLDANLSLHSFAHVLAQVDVLISNDTGPVHLACAINRPVIALYAATDPYLCGPHQAKNAFPVFKGPTCTPCIKRKCKLPFCLLQISPKEIADLAITLIKNNKNLCNLELINSGWLESGESTISSEFFSKKR